ncbi:MAG: hypothetical protein H6Q86_5635, partial [candidate division NC10 bacterium]|nr:hypothetical protein [candidate division NC10 bacterium]
PIHLTVRVILNFSDTDPECSWSLF